MEQGGLSGPPFFFAKGRLPAAGNGDSEARKRQPHPVEPPPGVCGAARAATMFRPPTAYRQSMEHVMSAKNNRIDYVEFAAKDLAAFKKFYGAAFGWTFQDWGPDYVSFEGAGIDGGVRGGETPVAGTTTVILYADDLDAAEKSVVRAGGAVTARHEFPGGRRFHFRDPTGNELAVWTKSGE